MSIQMKTKVAVISIILCLKSYKTITIHLIFYTGFTLNFILCIDKLKTIYLLEEHYQDH